MIVRNSRYKQVLPDTIAYKGQTYTKAYAKGKLLFANTDDDYEYQYFTVESLEDGNVITFTIPAAVTTSEYTSVSYSVDGGTTWTTLTNDGSTSQTLSVTLNAGDKVIWKGTGNTTTHDTSINNSCSLKGTKEHIMYGNIASLLYGDNFYGQTSFPSSGYGFCCLFYNNTYVTDASNLVLPFTNLRAYCYGLLFRACIRLTKTPKLPATTMMNRCYWQMFSQCTSLEEGPELNSTILNFLCYGSMFYGCTSLVKAPELPATTLEMACYQYMFYGCTSLTEAPELPATTLLNQCYQNMFYGCTNLNYIKCLATDISATNCTTNWVNNVAATGTFIKADTMNDWTIDSVNGIPIGWTLHNYENCTVTLSVNDSSYGTVDGAGTYHTGDMVTIKANAADGYRFVGWYDGSTLVSQNEGYTFEIWTNVSYQAVFEVGQVDYSTQYFTIESLEDGNSITLTMGGYKYNIGPRRSELSYIAYSVDNGTNWTTTNMNGTAKKITVRLNNYKKVMFKGSGTTLACCNPGTSSVGIFGSNFSSTKKFKMYGNIMSLLYDTNFSSQTTMPYVTINNIKIGHNFLGLFIDCSGVVDAEHLVLPATTLTPNCYEAMFDGCTSLVSSPVLPATTLSILCYDYMFRRCTSLTTAPALPATTLRKSCYNGMFCGCTSLTTAPALPATTLASWCYNYMFYGCSSLTTAPELPSTTAPTGCYYQMFCNCNSLVTAPDLVATSIGQDAYNGMLANTKVTIIKVYAVSSSWSLNIAERPSWQSEPTLPSSGTFFVKPNATSNILNACPTGWTISKTL